MDWKYCSGLARSFRTNTADQGLTVTPSVSLFTVRAIEPSFLVLSALLMPVMR